MKTWQKIAYAAGSLGVALSYQAFTNRIQFLYIDELRLDPRVIATIWFVYGLWNALNDPLMGQLSDNTRTRFGRRIPYIIFATLPMVAFFIMMWLPPRGASPLILFIYFTATVFIFDTLWSLVVIAWTALFPEMISDLNERAAVSGWRQVFSIIGLLAALAAMPIVIDTLGWNGMAWAFGAMTFVSFMVSLLGSRENPSMHKDEAGLPLWQALKATLTNKSFLWFLLANTAVQFIFTVMVAALPFYAKYAVQLRNIPGGLDAATQESLLLGVPFILAVPGFAVWTRITQRIGSRRALMAAALAFLPGLITVFFAPTFVVTLVGTTLLVLGLPGLLMITDLIISDVIDEDELKVGHRREGMFFGMNGALIRLAYSAQALLLFVVTSLTGYDPALAVQPPAVEWGFRAFLAGGPMIGILIVVFAMRFYPLHGATLTAARAELAELHARKLAEAAASTD